MNFVTGATGLLGSYLAKHLLLKGEKVRALKRKTSDTSLLGNFTNQIEWVEGDVLDISSLEETMANATYVYHCAAVISFIPKEVDNMLKVNIEGTANVMNAAMAAGVKKIIHVSSEASFGIPRGGKTIDENYSDPHINKCTWYYRSKHYGEREAWRAYAEGANVVVVCPATILGGGWWNHEPNSLFNEVYNGLLFYTKGGNGFIDVRDLTECMHRLMHSEISGEKFLMLSENHSLRDITWMIADALQKKRPSVKIGKALIDVAWRAEALKSLMSGNKPILTKESATFTEIDFRYSNEKIKRALNYNFIPVEQTIKETAAIFLKSKAAGKNFGVLI